MAVLIDEYSASAAEILSGAIQDQDRGIVVGRRSFGKGLVQRPFNMPDGSMIRLTTARYYTPSGRSIQKPYEKGKNLDYAKDVINRYNKGELTNADSIHFPDSLRYQTLRKGRTVYGGGGIMPWRGHGPSIFLQQVISPLLQHMLHLLQKFPRKNPRARASTARLAVKSFAPFIFLLLY